MGGGRKKCELFDTKSMQILSRVDGKVEAGGVLKYRWARSTDQLEGDACVGGRAAHVAGARGAAHTSEKQTRAN